MLKLITFITIISLFSGCASFFNSLNDAQITAGTTLATKFILNEIPGKDKPVVSAWAYKIATDLSALTSPLTPDQLSALILSSIPANVQTNYPEIASYVVPVIIAEYQTYYGKISGNTARVLQLINDIANGVKAASTPAPALIKFSLQQPTKK